MTLAFYCVAACHALLDTNSAGQTASEGSSNTPGTLTRQPLEPARFVSLFQMLRPRVTII